MPLAGGSMLDINGTVDTEYIVVRQGCLLQQKQTESAGRDAAGALSAHGQSTELYHWEQRGPSASGWVCIASYHNNKIVSGRLALRAAR